MMWSPVTPKNDGSTRTPSSRFKHSVTLHGSHLYLLAGRNGNIPLKDLWRYSLSDGVWELLEPSGDRPPCLQEHTAVTYRDSIYVFGGELGFSSCNEAPLWVYNIKENSWRKMRSCQGATVPKGRRGHTALVHRTTMIVYGGYRDLRGSSNELWAFHFDSESWHLISNSKNSAPARHKHSMMVHDGSIWIYGGMADLQEKSDLWRYDIVGKTWSQVKSKMSPGAIHSHAVCKLPSSMLVFGGERGGQPTNELWRFRFGTETWERLSIESVLPQPRSESVALIIPDLLLQENRCVKQTSPRRMRGGGSMDRGGSAPTNKTQATSNLSILRELSRISQLNLPRLGQSGANCSYSMLSSSESISETSLSGEMVKSQSAHLMSRTGALPRDPVSVPNFSSLTSTLTPVEVTKLIYLDDENTPISEIPHPKNPVRKRIPKSASVRFGATPEEVSETSDYASMETMNRLSNKDKEGPYSFSNPNYLGPDIKEILTCKEHTNLNSPQDSLLEDRIKSTKKSELIEMKPIPPKSLPLDLNVYNTQMNKKGRAYSATRAQKDATFSMFVIGGKERGQVTVFKRPLSIWKLQLNSSVY